MLIHAWVCLACVIVLGTLISMVFYTPYFIASHIDSMLLYVVFCTPYYIASHIDFMLLYVVFCTPYVIASHIDSMLLYVVFLYTLFYCFTHRFYVVVCGILYTIF